LARKEFYQESITYLNTSEDDGQATDPVRILSAEISPLRTKPARGGVPQILPLNVSQFYSVSSSVNEKVVQFSIISSGRPDPSNLPLSAENSNN
jgi:hypothetical protein